MSESDPHTTFSHPSFGWAGLPVINHSGAVWALQVLCHFSLHMSRLTTPANPPESHLYDSFV